MQFWRTACSFVWSWCKDDRPTNVLRFWILGVCKSGWLRCCLEYQFHQCIVFIAISISTVHWTILHHVAFQLPCAIRPRGHCRWHFDRCYSNKRPHCCEYILNCFFSNWYISFLILNFQIYSLHKRLNVHDRRITPDNDRPIHCVLAAPVGQLVFFGSSNGVVLSTSLSQNHKDYLSMRQHNIIREGNHPKK